MTARVRHTKISQMKIKTSAQQFEHKVFSDFTARVKLTESECRYKILHTKVQQVSAVSIATSDAHQCWRHDSHLAFTVEYPNRQSEVLAEYVVVSCLMFVQ